MIPAEAIVGIVLGSVFIVVACGAVLYYFWDHIISEFSQTQQQAQEQMRQVVDQTVPPDYNRHELDPVCVFEHELHPYVVAGAQPILVHSSSADFIIPPEEDPLVIASTPRASFMPFPEPTSTFSADVQENTNNIPASIATPAAAAAAATATATATGDSNASEIQESQSPESQISITPNPSTPTSGLSTGPPRFVNQSMLNMAHLASPPSYDVPNRVVAVSPLSIPHSRHHHSRSASDVPQFMPSPANTLGMQQSYYGQVRTRSHTISHPEPYQPPTTTVTSATQEETPDTPRYSLEFPSNVPHERHLEEHQRARAQYEQWELFHRQEHSILMQGQPFSQFYSPSVSTTSSFTPNTRDAVFGSGSPSSSSSILGRGRANSGGRPRASTIGESSKLLIQRMQALLRRTSQSAGGAGENGGFSPRFENSLTPNLQQQQRQRQEMESGFVGLGIEQQQAQQQGEHQVQQAGEAETEAETEAENSNDVAIVVEPEEESNGSSSPSSTSPSSSEQRQEEQDHHEDSSVASVHSTQISITRTRHSEAMDLSIPTISAPLTAS
ncbi:hypothetical protein BGZ80_009475 [Entomortierella chlamydospora]|uniref:Uncharacterized protein n=1 Tax=Entomortierella chlamydospora TaxID=101097 RepID=A0A9P6MX05_9FUNG|nr:hypothetical protein BGZ79_008910 [Entomortierella chlamydospora]KAG0016042.1 hypothetical protein BGZ80_009475 [Entomortierella chlamydospora]